MPLLLLGRRVSELILPPPKAFDTASFVQTKNTNDVLTDCTMRHNTVYSDNQRFAAEYKFFTIYSQIVFGKRKVTFINCRVNGPLCINIGQHALSTRAEQDVKY